jgi:NitT/TauT family transport system substrate-binding protein
VAKIDIMFSRFSAFYSPLIATGAAGFLKAEGLEPEFSVASPARPARATLAAGEVQVIQSAVSASWAPLERGEASDIVHFAQINQRDGFFLAARRPDPALKGVDFAALQAIDAGGPAAMEAAFRAGRGDYVHLQGPAPQQLEKDGIGQVVAAVGEAFGPVAFSSLSASRRWLQTDMARAFTRAYAKARAWVVETPAAEIAKREAAFFEGVDEAVLARTIDAYQRLGSWRPPLEIPRDAYEVALDVFQHSGRIGKRHPYDAVVVPPPAF